MSQVVDPQVSRSKFDREISLYRAAEAQYIGRGWWLMRAQFPTVKVAFVTPHAQPQKFVAFTVLIDFTNYDLEPPSVKFVDPFTDQPIAYPLLPGMYRIPDDMPDEAYAAARAAGAPVRALMPNMIQPGDPPFLCLPGVREYHANPAHTGDNWLLHRGSGEGSLFFILDQISTYGSECVSGLEMQVVMSLGQDARR